MITIPNQSSIPKVFLEFNDDNRMQLSPLYQSIVDVCEELVKFTWLTRGRADYATVTVTVTVSNLIGFDVVGCQ